MRERADPALQEIRLKRLLKHLGDAAERGQHCPRNSDIAALLGLHSSGHAAYYLARLETHGRILVERGNSMRVVTIFATGKRTAGEVLQPHWRTRPVTSSIAPRPRLHRSRWRSAETYLSDEAVQRRARQVAAEEAFITSITVSRDPCPRCGVRGDIPHTHRSRT